MSKLALVFVVFTAAFMSPATAWSHDGKLDAYGCHYDEEHKNYHCHEGSFKGGSFQSKLDMIRQLKQQYMNLGRPWPYDTIAEEDITSAEKPAQ